MPKTLAFCPALTVGEIDDVPRLSAVAVAVGLMYWGDQTMDRGDDDMINAVLLLGAPKKAAASPAVKTRLKALRRIADHINILAKSEDAPYVLACFYDQVLNNEARLQQLTRDYLAASDGAAFLGKHGAALAELTTISAGFPSISSSLYAIYRQHDDALPPLATIYKTPALVDYLQVCNVVVRIWDELGDWQMDAGHDPRKGLFVINPFNQYDPMFVHRFCELAFMGDPKEQSAMQEAFARFHTNRVLYAELLLDLLSRHIRRFTKVLLAHLSAQERQAFDRYLTLCHRVLEIGYVNRVGDIALAKQ